MTRFAHSHGRSFTERPAGIAMIATLSAAAGAVVATLFTPKRGSELRSTIAGKARQVRAKLQKKTDNIVEEVKDKSAESAAVATDVTSTVTDQAKESGDVAKDKLDKAADSAKQKTGEAADSMRRHNGA